MGDNFVDQKTYHERLARLKRVLLKRCVFAPETAITDWAVNTDWNGVLFFGNTNEWGVVCGFMRVARAGTQVLRERKIAVFREQKGIPDVPDGSGSLRLIGGGERQLLANMREEDSTAALRFVQSMLAQWQTGGSVVQRLTWDPAAQVWQADCRLVPFAHDDWKTTIHNVSWDARGGVVVRIVEIVGGEAVDAVPASILESYAEAASSTKPEGPLTSKIPAAGVKTVRFWRIPGVGSVMPQEKDSRGHSAVSTSVPAFRGSSVNDAMTSEASRLHESKSGADVESEAASDTASETIGMSPIGTSSTGNACVAGTPREAQPAPPSRGIDWAYFGVGLAAGLALGTAGAWVLLRRRRAAASGGTGRGELK